MTEEFKQALVQSIIDQRGFAETEQIYIDLINLAKESNDQLRRVVQMMRLQLVEEMGNFKYDSWVDSHFNSEYKSSFGL